MRAPLWVLGTVAWFFACGYAPHPKDGKLPCDEGCPGGYVCGDGNRCWLTSTMVPEAGAGDVPVPSDSDKTNTGGATSETGSQGGSGGQGGSRLDGPDAAADAGAGGTTKAGGAGGAGGGVPGTGGVAPADAPMDTPATGGAVPTGGTVATGGLRGSGGVVGTGGLGLGGATSVGGNSGTGGGIVGTGGSTVVTPPSACGNGLVETGEQCDCGVATTNLPSACKSINGLFYGDGKGCSRTCTREPTCLDGSGRTQPCSTACGDGNIDANEACDDGNRLDGDGCSSTCQKESGFACSIAITPDSVTCQSGLGQCLELPTIYRDFQPENVSSGGHPDFSFLGTRYNGSSKSTTICVPNSAGPSKGNDSTSRCWGIAKDTLLNGKPQPGPTTTCACKFSDWNIGNSSRIPGNYTQAANDSPLSDGNAGFQGVTAGTPVSTTSTAGPYTGTLTGYTSSTPGGPVWNGIVPAYKDATSFKQWFNDDASVNRTYTAVLELSSSGTNSYRYASQAHLAEGGFFPLDTLNPSQATLCNLWPYWNHGNGNPIWTTCAGDQYLFPPRIVAGDCEAGSNVASGCWVTGVPGVRHNFYFTAESHYLFTYDGTTGLSLKFYGQGDLFIFINGVLVLDLGGIHNELPGQVVVTGEPGDAKVTEGGCLDAAGDIVGVATGATECGPKDGSTKVPAADQADFRVRSVSLGLVSGKVYDIAIFYTNRSPVNSDYQLTLSGSVRKKSVCQPN